MRCQTKQGDGVCRIDIYNGGKRTEDRFLEEVDLGTSIDEEMRLLKSAHIL